MRPPSLLAALSVLLLNSCYPAGDGKAPPLEELYFPTGVALDGYSKSVDAYGNAAPKYLYVANSDFDLQYRWYLEDAGEEVAERYLDAVEATLRNLAIHPGLGRPREFRHPSLKDIRSFRVNPPFQVHLIFYRYNSVELLAERLMRGSRDLPHRLAEPPGS